MTTTNILKSLPPSMQNAQMAIDLPEVQEIIKQLSKYNLGVFMPHMHNTDAGEFIELPQNIMQIENDLQVDFVDRNTVNFNNTVPVGWTWMNNGVQGYAACSFGCHLETSPTTGAIVHIKNHK